MPTEIATSRLEHEGFPSCLTRDDVIDGCALRQLARRDRGGSECLAGALKVTRPGTHRIAIASNSRKLPTDLEAPVGKAITSEIALRGAEDPVGEGDGRRAGASVVGFVADAAGVRAARCEPAGAARCVVRETLQEGVACGRELRARAVAGAAEAGGQAARTTGAVELSAPTTGSVLARTGPAVAVESARLAGTARGAGAAAVDVGLVLVPHQVVTARRGARAVAADAGVAIFGASAGAAGGAGAAVAAAVAVRLRAVLHAVLAGGLRAAPRRLGAEE